MARASKRVCTTPGCPTLTTGTRCPAHQADHERARGTRQQRGYDALHDRMRKAWAPKVAAGTIRCTRCQQPIDPATPWDLGHTDDRRAWTGPEHAVCNRVAAGQKSPKGGG